MRKLLWIFPLLALGTFGCRERAPENVAAPAAHAVPDMEESDGTRTVRFYNAANAYTARVIGESAGTYAVRSERERFEARGYRYRAGHSFVTEGAWPDGRQMQIAMLAMENTRAPEEEAVFLFVLKGKSRDVVVPARLVRAESAPDEFYREIGDGLWFGVVDPLREFTGAGAAARFSLRRWGSCIAGGLLRSLATCAATCRFALAGYAHCLGVCGGIVSVGTILDCTIQELF